MTVPMSDGETSNPDRFGEWDDDEIGALLSTSVNPLAVTVFSGPPGSIGLNPKTKNVLLLTEVRANEPWNGMIQMFDEVWVTPGSPDTMARSLIPHDRIKVVFPTPLRPSPMSSLNIPRGDPTVMMHEGWSDARGIEAAVRAWLRNDNFSDGVLITSIRSSNIDQSAALMTRIRSEEGRPRGRNRIFLMTTPSRRSLDACLLSSDVLICSHVEDNGWRHLAIKAALAGKMVVSTNRGDITKHLTDCQWVDAPDFKNVTYDTMETAMEKMSDEIGRGISRSLSTDARPAVVMRFPMINEMPEFLKEAGDRLVSPGR